jgi:hypothetical protein
MPGLDPAITFLMALIVVIAGLDPAIHLLRKVNGCPGQARA